MSGGKRERPHRLGGNDSTKALKGVRMKKKPGKGIIVSRKFKGGGKG